MTEETQGTVQTDATDTAAVLALASGADKTYVSEPKAETPAEPDGEPEDLGDDAPAATDEPAAKARKSAQDRIDELTAARRQAERDAEYWREQAMRSAPKAEPTPEPAQGDGKPDPEKFEGGVYDPLYVEALTDWKAEQAVSRLIGQRDSQTRLQTALQTFDQRVKEQYPDGEPAGITALRNLPGPQFPTSIFDLLTASEQGPKVAEHLGSNLSEFQRLSALPPHLQGAEFARLEGRLATPPASPAKTATDAPEPAPTVRGAGGRFKVSADTNDFSAFERQYVGG
jgi:hypothetical protein